MRNLAAESYKDNSQAEVQRLEAGNTESGLFQAVPRAQ